MRVCACVLALVDWYASHMLLRRIGGYCRLWPVWPYHILSHYLTNATIFGKDLIKRKMCVLIFCTSFVGNISHSKKNLARYYYKGT
jgi:hypothetical protein